MILPNVEDVELYRCGSFRKDRCPDACGDHLEIGDQQGSFFLPK